MVGWNFGRYVDDDEGIKNYFAAFHLQHPTFPLSGIIDDFADFFDERLSYQLPSLFYTSYPISGICLIRFSTGTVSNLAQLF